MVSHSNPQLLRYNQTALTGNFYPANLAVKMQGKYYHNSTNYLIQEDIDKLLSAPKVYVENYNSKSRLKNLSGEFRNVNQKAKLLRVKNVEYYASVIEGKVHLFAVSYASYRDVNSTSISYLPNGNVNEAIFLARVCRHANEHINSDGTKIEAFELHIHKATQEYFENTLKIKSGKHPSKIAAAFYEADAEKLNMENEDVKKIARREFLLERNLVVSISSRKDNVEVLKRDIEDKLAYKKAEKTREYIS